MIDILFNCFNSLNIYLILFIGFIFYLIKKKSTNEEIENESEKCAIDSIERRSEECPQNYPNGWLPVYHSLDLKKGEVKPIFALGRDLVIYRGTSGKVYVFDAYCPHLGANLGVGGTVVGDDIKCHFHGWQFNNQGDCEAIPGLEDKSIPKATIRKWRCDEVNYLIYVWHHLEGKEPDWFIPKLENIENLFVVSKPIANAYCHIQDIKENEADFAHFYPVHSEKLVPKYLRKYIQIIFTSILWEVWDPPNTHIARAVYQANVKIGGFSLIKFSFECKSIGPANLVFYIHVDFGIQFDFIINNNTITSGKCKQTLFTSWYYNSSIISYFHPLLSYFLISNVVTPDISIWNRKRFVRNPKVTKSDKAIVPFRRWYQQFYSENPKVD